MNEKKWDFVYDEEIYDDWGDNILGIISNGEDHLFFHVRKVDEEDEREICAIYSSLMCLYQDEESEVEYQWSDENDALLLRWLNKQSEQGNDVCGEGCGIRSIEFHRYE